MYAASPIADAARAPALSGIADLASTPPAPPGHAARTPADPVDASPSDTIETRLWLDEHDWLLTVLHSSQNLAPTFRMPDLISACVSLVFREAAAPQRIFDFMGRQLVLRPPHMPRRRESMWRVQYELLLAVQRSPANRHPNPKFQLDQLTTACVALARLLPDAPAHVLHQARHNMAARSAARSPPAAGG